MVYAISQRGPIVPARRNLSRGNGSTTSLREKVVRPRRFPNLTREGTDVIVEITMAVRSKHCRTDETGPRESELRQAASSPPVFSASCLCPCPTSALHSPHSSLNLQYDVGAGLRLSHKSGAIVSSPPTRSPGASSAGTRVRGMQRLLSLVKTQRATDGEEKKKETKRGRKKILEISNDQYSDMLGIAKNAQATW